MTALNQTTLRGILAQITSVNSDYIVPKQGNWWNPQEIAAIKPHNWCAYSMNHQTRTAPFYHRSDDQEENAAVTLMRSEISLQFVGPDSEDIAQSVALWPLRSDVQAEFKKVGGAIALEDIPVISSPFYQDGFNTVQAWNATIHVLWYKQIGTNQSKILTIGLGGHIDVKI